MILNNSLHKMHNGQGKKPETLFKIVIIHGLI